MRDTITVECQKLNGRMFIGTVNFSEAKVKIFQVGLGLDTGLLGSVKITFNKCPVISFKLYKVGRNLLVNRFKTLNNKIDYSWFNDSFKSFKIKCKSLLL